MLGVRLRLRAQAATDGAEFRVSTTLATIRRMQPRGLIARPVIILIPLPFGLMNRARVVVVGSNPTQRRLNRMAKQHFLKNTSGGLVALPVTNQWLRFWLFAQPGAAGDRPHNAAAVA